VRTCEPRGLDFEPVRQFGCIHAFQRQVTDEEFAANTLRRLGPVGRAQRGDLPVPLDPRQHADAGVGRETHHRLGRIRDPRARDGRIPGLPHRPEAPRLA
jgi:hypothetical protein